MRTLFNSTIITRSYCFLGVSACLLGFIFNGKLVLASELIKFQDLPLPSAIEFGNNLKASFEGDVKEFLGYAVPVTITALFIRSTIK